MKLKNVPFTVYKGISDEIIDDQLSIVPISTPGEADETVFNQTANSKDFRECKALQVYNICTCI